MPEVDQSVLDGMVAKVPEGQRLAFLQDFKARGYTIKAAGRADAGTAAGKRPVYPQEPPLSKRTAAWQAAKDAWKTPVPGLDQAGKFLSETAPGYIAEKTGASSSPLVQKAGLAAGTALGTAGEMVPRTVGDVSGQLLAAPLLKGAGAAVKALTPARELAGKIGTALLARDIGVAEPFIENVKRNPAALKDLSNDMSVVLDHTKTLSEIMKRGVDRLGTHIREVEDKFVEQRMADPRAMKTVSLDDISQKLKELKFRAGVAEDSSPAALLNQYGKPTSTIPAKLSKIDAITGADADKIKEYASEVGKIKDKANALDLLRLKRRLGDEIAWGKGDEAAKKIGSQTNGILKGLYKDVQAKLDGLSPELKQASAKYSNARRQYDILQRQVFGGDPAQAYQRVKLRIQRGVGPQALIERAAQINSTAERAMRGIIDKVSAQQFAPYVRKGIAGGFLGIGAVGGMEAALGGHGLYPLVADLGAAAVSSPRLAALGIRGESAAKTAISQLAAQVGGLGASHPLALRAIGQGIAHIHRAQAESTEQGKP